MEEGGGGKRVSQEPKNPPKTKKLRDALLGDFGLFMIPLAGSSMRARGVRVQGHDEMAVKLLFWELEQHLKR